ncbi:MAG: ATP-binding protein, partial [bacterium]
DKSIQNHFGKYKQVLTLIGPRQVGKTTLLKRVFPDSLYLVMDINPIRSIFESFDVAQYRSLFKDSKLIVLDELQLLTDPGRVAKLIYDNFPDIKLIITGSASLDIKNRTTESLAGRKIEYYLLPLTFGEYLFQTGTVKELKKIDLNNLNINGIVAEVFDVNAQLTEKLIWGNYPALIDLKADERYLDNLVNSTILKDILELKAIENKTLALNLLKLLAFQIGSLVSYAEIAQKLMTDHRTIRKYIEIFEKAYIIFRLYPLTSNSRDVIVKAPKIYFYDLGIRNSLINNFNDLAVRNDSGFLFENFIISEIIKTNLYEFAKYDLYYFRDRNGYEVDLVLSKNNKLTALEIKYTGGSLNKGFANRYPEAKSFVVTKDNFWLMYK